MGTAMVVLEDVHLSLESAAGSVNILRGVDLSIGAGETLGLVGASGSGKSTMMAVIAGLERPSAGSVRVNGADLGGLSEDGLALFRRDTIGIVFQSFHLVPTMTALENVAIPLEFAGRRDAFAAANTELERVGLGQRVGHYPSELSGGEQQRVALARAVGGRTQAAARRRADRQPRLGIGWCGHRSDVLVARPTRGDLVADQPRRGDRGALRPGGAHGRRPRD